MLKTLEELAADDKASWLKWYEEYGKDHFYDAFLTNAQDAISTCIHCQEEIYLDIVEGGGVPDWGTVDGSGGGDYGCPDSPDTTKEGTGGHEPKRFIR